MDPTLVQTISKILAPFANLEHTATNAVKSTNAAIVIFDIFLYHIEDINIEDPGVERFINSMLAKAIEGQQKSSRKAVFDEYVNEFNKLLERIREARVLEHEPTTTVDNPRHGSSHCRRELSFCELSVADTEKHVQDKLKLKLTIDQLQKNTSTTHFNSFWNRIRKQVDNTEEFDSSKISRLQRELQRMM